MNQMDALYKYFEAEQRKLAIEKAVRNTAARQKYHKLVSYLKEQQAILAKLTDEVEQKTVSVKRMTDYGHKLNDRIDMEQSELDTMQNDDETTAEEMTELKVDLEKLNREIGNTEREAKALLSELDRAVEAYQKARSEGAKAKKEYDEAKAVCEQESETAKETIVQQERVIVSLESEVDPVLLDRYNTVKKHVDPAIAKVVNDQCSGCNMSLSMTTQKKLAAGREIVECENCGRILYHRG